MEPITPSKGNLNPLGFSLNGKKGNFALFSEHAQKVTLGLFQEGAHTPFAEFPMEKTGSVWHLALERLPAQPLLYGFRVDNVNAWLSDPYSNIVGAPAEWGCKERGYLSYAAMPPSFDWQGAKPPRIAVEDLVIYEMHVRGFTKHPSSKVQAPGTFLGVIEKIPYLKQLGVNAIELMPVFEFDEVHCKDIQPQTGEPLTNYWGYNSLFFFAPMRRYSAHPSIFSPIQEFKTMVRELHRNGIEVILDVVYNHTGEGKEKEYFVNFRGIDNATYYMVDGAGNYRDYTGCGNTFNCNHPQVQQFVLDSLSFWVDEMHVDGFRFDLASIFTRGLDGTPMRSPPILDKISSLFPKEKGIKLIAEAWDAAGLYQVGLFPNHWKGWSDWNGKYRDAVRRFIKGTPGYASAFADAISGSESVYGASGTPLSSINFVTAHDGYSLRDLVTYQMKHNYENGEMNQDGNNQNDNWNCGAEGPTQNQEVLRLREKQMRNFLLALFLSQGIPMILMGDEYGHSRRGNNNPYVQDNELNWFLWNFLEKNQPIFSFVASLIAFRKNHPALRRKKFLTHRDVAWHGTTLSSPNWDSSSQLIAYTLQGPPSLFVAFNAHNFANTVQLPESSKWRLVVFTENDWDSQFSNAVGTLGSSFQLTPYSALLAVEVVS